MRINPFLLMIASLVLLISVAIVFAANEQDCIGTTSTPCHICDVTNMSIKIYDPSDELIGTEYLIYDSETGTCDSAPGITETWKKHLDSSYFTERGEYKATVYAQIVGGEWEYSANLTFEVKDFYCPSGVDVGCLDCTGTSANPCNICDVTNMSIKIYDSSDELIGTEYLIYDSETGTCDSAPGITETWKKNIGSSYFSEDGQYNIALCAQIADGDWECADNETIRVGTFSITIYPEWNLISIPYKEIIAIDDPCNAFSGSFYPWNSTDREWGALSLSQLNGGEAYWLRSKNGCTLTVTGVGSIETSDIPPLKAGYNFVGAPTNGIDALVGCNIITGPLYWDTSTQNWVTSTTIEPTKGYWIRVENDCQFS